MRKFYTVEDMIIIAMILFLFGVQFLQVIKNRNFQTQIDELRIIVNQRVLPALILDKESLEVR